MPSKIQVRARDPKIYEFPTNDLMNNHRDGRLFYRSHSTLYLINACPSESIASGCGCPVTASNLLVCGDITASGLVLTEGGGISEDEVDLTGNVTIGTSCDQTLTVNSSATFNCAITASIISASGVIIADNFQSTGGDVSGITFSDDMNLTGDITASGIIQTVGLIATGDVQLGDNCSDDINILGTITSSCDISSSGVITGEGLVISDDAEIGDQLQVNGTATFSQNVMLFGDLTGDNATNISGIDDITTSGDTTLGSGCVNTIILNGNITASCNISASNTNGNHVIGGDIQLGNTCGDDINVLGTITASCDISSSGTITGLTGSFDNIDGLLTLIGDPTEPTSLEIDGDLEVINITASGDISASGDLIVGGDTFLGDGCDDTLTVNATSVFKCDVTFEGAVTSSIISSSIIYSSGSNIFGDAITDTHYFHGNITSSGNISASGGGSVLGGSTTIGDTCNDTLTINSEVIINCDITSSANISASGYITASNITAESFNITNDGDLNPTINVNTGDTTGYLVFVGDVGDGGQQGLLNNSNLFFDAANNVLEVPTLQTTEIEFTDGDVAMTIADGGGVTFPQTITANGNIEGDNSTNISGINDLTTLGNTTLGNACSDQITLNGTVTASCTISSSGTITGLSSSFEYANIGDHLVVGGNISVIGNIIGNNSTNISGISDLTVLGNTTLGNSCSDTLTIDSQTIINCDITSSANISASGYITASNIVAETFTIIGDGSLEPTINENTSDTSGYLVFVGDVGDGSQQGLLNNSNLFFDAANNVLEVPTLQTTEIEYTDGDVAMTIANGGGVTFTSDITANGNITGDNSTNISGINDLTVIGNTSLGNSCSDTLTVNAQTTFECPVTASIISASTFTGSFVGDGSNLTGIGGGNPTINQSDSATNYITFVRTNPDTSAQQLFGDDDLTFEAEDNILTTNIFSVKDRIHHDGDTDTKIEFTSSLGDQIKVHAGNEQFIKIYATGSDDQDYIEFGDEGDIDFIVKGQSTSDLLFIDAAKNKIGFNHTPETAHYQFTFDGTVEVKNNVSMSNSQVIIGRDIAHNQGTPPATGFTCTIINHEDTIDSGDVLKLQIHVASPDSPTFNGDINEYYDAIDAAEEQAAGTKFIEFYSGTDVVGAIQMDLDGSVSFTQTSDERKKENIVPTDFKLEDLLKLKIKDFHHKNRLSSKKDTGLIAQEVKEIFPQLVGIDSSKEFLTVKYHKLIPLLVKSIQDQQEIINSLEGRIKKLENKQK